MSRLSRFLPKFLRGGDKSSQNVKSGDKSHLKIIFLDETEYFLPYKGSSKGQYVLDKVFEQLNLFEKDYFGLRFLDPTGQTHWLDPNKTLSSQLKGCSLPYTLYFGVKFYPADPCKLKEEITRYQFFMQVKQDILHGRLPVTFEEAAELFAYAVQSELGDYNSQSLPPGYVSEFQFVPSQTEELEDQIAGLHRRLGGTIPATAELKFLDKVKWLDMYGVDLHPVLGESNTEYFLGLTPTGIVVYKNKTKVGNYFWPRITKVTFKGKVFIIKVKDKINDEHVYAFELTTKAACKHLWKCCVEHHSFFRTRLSQLGEASSRTSKPFRSTAKHRNSGRGERQSSTDQGGREEPRVLRVQSRRQARRAMSDSRLNQGDSMMTGVQFSEGHITMVVTPEQVKGPRHRSLPDLKGRESPTSTRSAPWETNMDTGLYTSGRESPVSVTQSENVNYRRHHRDSDSEPGHRRNNQLYGRGYDSDGGRRVKHRHHQQQQYHSGYLSLSGNHVNHTPSRRSGYESDPYTSGGSQGGSHRRKYFPSSRKGSDNESDVSFTRRRRREMGDSGSESDSPSKYAARQRKAKSMGPDKFDRDWNDAVQNMYLSDRDTIHNGSVPSVHSAPLAEARQKKMRRRRSKSPGTSKRPPEELKQHIEFDLIDPEDLTEDQIRQMQEIPYVNVETKAEPFKVKYSPKTNRQRYRSPKRKSYGELEANKGGYQGDEPPPPYTRTPERTPEPAHRQLTKTGGYYSDTGSKVSNTGSLPREKKNPPPYNQLYANNSSGYSKHQIVTDIRSIPQFHDNLLFYEPNYSPRYQTNFYRNPMVQRYHPPPTAVFKPIEDQTDRGSVVEQATGNSHATLSMTVNNMQWKICLLHYPIPSRPVALHMKAPSQVNGEASELKLDLQGQLSDDEHEGQGHDGDDDRQRDSNRDSGLNSSQGSNSTMVNTPPRHLAGRMFGTQDAIARLYSSPAGTRKLLNSAVNQPGPQVNKNSAFAKQQSLANQRGQYNSHDERASNHNQYNSSASDPTAANPHMSYSHSKSQNPPYVNVSSVSAQQGNSYSLQNGGQNYGMHPQSYNQSRDFQDVSNGYGYGTHSSSQKMFYSNTDSQDSQYVPSHDNLPNSQTASYQSNNNSYNSNSYVPKNAQYSQQRYNGDVGFYGNGAQQTGNSRPGHNQSRTQANWQYVQANGENGNQSTMAPSPYSQKKSTDQGLGVPIGRSSSTSPTKTSSVRRQVPLTPVRDSSRTSVNTIGRSPNVTSPDSAISSLTSLSLNNNNYKSPSGSVSVTQNGHMTQQNSGSPTIDGYTHERGTENFSRTRMPAFGRSDIWTEL